MAAVSVAEGATDVSTCACTLPVLTRSGLSARAQHICCIESERTERRMMRCDIYCATVAATGKFG